MCADDGSGSHSLYVKTAQGTTRLMQSGIDPADQRAVSETVAQKEPF